MDDLESALRSYLRPGERIRWTGQPAQGLRFAARDAFLIPFSLLWVAVPVIAVFGIALGVATTTDGPTFPVLFLIPFLLVGSYLLAGRFILDAWARKRTIYAVTDQRVLLLRHILGERLVAGALGQTVRLKRERSGRGTIEFGPESASPWGYRGWGLWNPGLDNQLRFIGIDDVMQVYRLVDQDVGLAG
jgi:hypothetical protein